MQEPKSDNDSQLTEQVNQVLTANLGVVACLFQPSTVIYYYLAVCMNANVDNVKGTQTKQVTWSRTVLMKQMPLGPCCKLPGHSSIPHIILCICTCMQSPFDSHQARLDIVPGFHQGFSKRRASLLVHACGVLLYWCMSQDTSAMGCATSAWHTDLSVMHLQLRYTYSDTNC